MSRLVESMMRALAPLFLMKRPACSHKNLRGSLTCERDFPTSVTLQNLEYFAGLLATNSWRSRDALQIKTLLPRACMRSEG